MKTKFGQCLSIALDGLEGTKVETQAHICAGLPSTTIVGLPDTVLQESKDRVKAAIISCGLPWTEYRLTINLIPAFIKKTGSGFDLPIAIAILLAQGIIDKTKLRNMAFISELGLDGKLQAIQGILPMVIAAKSMKITKLIVAKNNLSEARLIDNIEVLAFDHLAEVINYFGGKLTIDISQLKTKNVPIKSEMVKLVSQTDDFIDVLGQDSVKYALMVAAAGRHNVYMVGPPGV
ncbi:MAG: ATP-binding protein, partial [Bifidobacteriaceae bacterium]|nr:ATP-binding protein [Bifidobacteriaceae bacterium]